MTAKALTVLVAVALGAGCYAATPYPGPDPLGDGGPDGGGDEPAVVPEVAAPGAPCTLEGTDDLGPSAYVIQIRNRECDTTVCLYYSEQSFCTHRCSTDGECADVAGGSCEFDLAVGDPEIIGRYCVTPSASRGG